MGKHVHIHLGRNTAARVAEQQRTIDADEGTWVTINGAHVMIGKGGKITKGPAALVGKTHGEAHEHAASEHDKQAVEHSNRGDGKTSAKHTEAALAHRTAAKFHKAGDPDASVHSKAAEEHSAGTKTVTSAKPKPKAHEKLHQEMGAKVKAIGSKKHSDEHDRLMGMYDNSKADWERSAINRKIEHNAVAAGQHDASQHEQKARDLSAAAHKSGKADDHTKAHEALKDAASKAMTHGGAGYAAKHAELTGMAKTHADAARKAAPREPAANDANKPAGASLINKAGGTPTTKHGNAAEHQASSTAHVTQAIQKGKGHADYGMHSQAASSHKKAAMALREAKGAAMEGKDMTPHLKAAQQHADEAKAHESGKGAAIVAAQKSTAQQAHADAAKQHRDSSEFHKAAGNEDLAKLHGEKAKHHEHMAANPKEDHSARGLQVRALGNQIKAAEKTAAKATPGKPAAKAPAGGSKAAATHSSVQGATEALKGLKGAVKKAQDVTDPDPKKQD